MSTVKNITLHLTEENQQMFEDIRKYVRDNPELSNRIAKRNSGALTTNRIVNSVLAEFSQLFLTSEMSFVDREKQLLMSFTDEQSRFINNANLLLEILLGRF